MSYPKRGGAPVSIRGGRSVGAVVTATPNPGWFFTSGQWYNDLVAISGATGPTYTRLAGDIGKRLTFVPTGIAYRADAGVTEGASTLLPVDSNIAFEGDSITAGGGATSASLVFQDTVNTGGRFRMRQGYNQAVSGETTAQMDDQVEIDALLATLPAVVVFMGGTNDIAATGRTPAQILSSITACRDAYIAGGAQYVVIEKITPRNDAAFLALSGARQADLTATNVLISGLAGDDTKIVDTPVGFDPATDTIDGLHPNWAGVAKLSAARAAVMNALIAQTDMRPLYLDPTNLLLTAGNPQLTGTAGTKSGGATGSSATGWTLAAALDGTMTVVGSKNGSFNGSEAQVITVGGLPVTAARNISFARSVTISGQIGDVFEAWIEFELAAGSSGVRSIGVFTTPSGAALGDSAGRANQVVHNADALGGVLRTMLTGTLTATSASISINITATFSLESLNAQLTVAKPVARKVV